jgi:hypothetical protein
VPGSAVLGNTRNVVVERGETAKLKSDELRPAFETIELAEEFGDVSLLGAGLDGL